MRNLKIKCMSLYIANYGIKCIIEKKNSLLEYSCTFQVHYDKLLEPLD